MSDDADGSRAEPGRRGKVQSAEYGLLVLKTLGRAGGNLTLTALAEQNRLNKLMEIAFVPQGRSGDAGGIGGFKTALELLGVIDSATMPAPLALLSDADRDAIRAILVEVDLLS